MDFIFPVGAGEAGRMGLGCMESNEDKLFADRMKKGMSWTISGAMQMGEEYLSLDFDTFMAKPVIAEQIYECLARISDELSMNLSEPKKCCRKLES